MLSYYIYEIPKKISDPIRKSRPLHLDGCINKFVRAVSLIPVREICSLQNPSESMSKFLETMYKAYYESFPIRKIVIKKRSKPPWLSQDLLYVIKKKHRLYKLLNRGIITRRSYTLYRNILTVLIRKCKQLYYKNKLHLSRNNSKETWNILNGMLGRNSNRKQISLSVNDVPLTGIQTVNHFNTYFTSVASDLVRNLSNNNNHPYGDNNLNATCVYAKLVRMK